MLNDVIIQVNFMCVTNDVGIILKKQFNRQDILREF
jgi:hypothetical protein